MNTLTRILIAALLAAASGAASTAEYKIAELPFGPSSFKAQYALTNAGVVALAAPSKRGYGFYGVAANAAGDMAGYELGPHGVTTAAVSGPTGTRLVPGLEARDINAHGDVIVNDEDYRTMYAELVIGGHVQRLSALSDKFDEFHWLPPFTPASYAAALNDRGHVVGWSNNSAEVTHAVLWRDGQIIDLHGSYGIVSAATDINNAGQIVINAGPYGRLIRTGVWANGSIAYLDGLSDGATYGAAINATGAVAGWAVHADGDHHATLWHDGLVFDLNAVLTGAIGELDYLDAAYGMNDLGQIIASGLKANGEVRQYLLTPVPEPSAWALLMCGLGTVWMRRRTHLTKVRA